MLQKSDRILLILGTLALVAIVAIYHVSLCRMLPELSERGLFGDSFGALTSVLTGLTFVSILYTIKQTREMLSETQKARDDASKQSLEAAKLQAIGNLIAASQGLFEYSKTVADGAKVNQSSAAVKIAESQMLLHADRLNVLATKLLDRLNAYTDTKIETSVETSSLMMLLIAEAQSLMQQTGPKSGKDGHC